jgi:hypothetical protein
MKKSHFALSFGIYISFFIIQLIYNENEYDI